MTGQSCHHHFCCFLWLQQHSCWNCSYHCCCCLHCRQHRYCELQPYWHHCCHLEWMKLHSVTKNLIFYFVLVYFSSSCCFANILSDSILLKSMKPDNFWARSTQSSALSDCPNLCKRSAVRNYWPLSASVSWTCLKCTIISSRDFFHFSDSCCCNV